MRKLYMSWIALGVIILVFVTGCGTQNSLHSGAAVNIKEGRVITDMAGRQVTLPEKIKKVYPVSPVEAVLLYTIDPELLIGWGYHMGADQSGYILPQYRDLPVISWLSRGFAGNIEEVIKLKPDIILMVNDITKANKDFADELQQLTKIPVVMLDKEMEKMEETYLLAGKVLNREERVSQLAAYSHETLELVQDKKPLLSNRKPVKVYYAEGRRGLETEPRGSWHAELIEFVGGINVADPGLPGGSNVGRSPVSLEQIMLWNPEVILIGYFRDGESSSFPSIMTDKAWQSVQAVRDKRVYEIPTGPFNWFDRPPAVSRLIGIRWVANLLYPDVYPFDFRSEVKRFYALFYHYQLSEQELDELADRTQRK